MALVGKKFPNITVDAISEMGDNLRINVLEEAVNNNKKVQKVKKKDKGKEIEEKRTQYRAEISHEKM